MNHRRVERIATDLCVWLVLATCFLSTVAIADGFLDWDLLEGFTEKLASFLIATLALLLAGMGMLSVVLSLRRMAAALEIRERATGGERR